MIKAQRTKASNVRKKIQGIPLPALGNGFSTDKQMAAQLQCFAPGRIRYAGSTTVSTTFSDSISFSQTQSILNVDVSSSLSIGMFSAGISENYARYIEQTRYSHALYYLANVTLPNQIFQPIGSGTSVLTSIGLDVYNGGPAQFRDVCGDKLITATNTGALLLVTMMIKFDSNYDSQIFSQHASVSWGDIFSATATITRVVTQYNLKGTVEFTALQSGGDPTQLAKIFSSCPTHYCITSCSLQNMDACTGVVTGVVHYAQKDFVPQVTGSNSTAGAQLSYSMNDVTELGLRVGPSVLNSTIIAARQTLGNIYKDMSTNSTFVKHLLSSPYKPYMYSTTQNALQANDNALDANLALLNDNSGGTGAIDCYFHPTNCPATAAALIPQLQTVDTAFLNGMDRGFTLNGQESLCDGVLGDSISIRAYLFPPDSTSNMYFITSNLNLRLSIVLTNTKLSIINAGTPCPIGHRVSDSKVYELNACQCVDGGACAGALCMLALGATDMQHGCNGDYCSGSLIVTDLGNPL
jgi:hypothetical protein